MDCQECKKWLKNCNCATTEIPENAEQKKLQQPKLTWSFTVLHTSHGAHINWWISNDIHILVGNAASTSYNECTNNHVHHKFLPTINSPTWGESYGLRTIKHENELDKKNPQANHKLHTWLLARIVRKEKNISQFRFQTPCQGNTKVCARKSIIFMKYNGSTYKVVGFQPYQESVFVKEWGFTLLCMEFIPHNTS